MSRSGPVNQRQVCGSDEGWAAGCPLRMRWRLCTGGNEIILAYDAYYVHKTRSISGTDNNIYLYRIYYIESRRKGIRPSRDAQAHNYYITLKYCPKSPFLPLVPITYME